MAPGSGLPTLLVGRRRWLLALLAGLGALQAVLAVFLAVNTPELLSGGARGKIGLAVQLVLAALLVGAARIGERVAAEDLGQDYLRSVRRMLVASALVPERSINLGTTIARATNDLSAVKNWVSLGISPLVVGVPLIGVTVVALFLVLPTIALVLVGTLAVFAAVMAALSKPLYTRARKLRSIRGRMAGQIADTVPAGDVIRASGGVEREVRRVDKLSEKVVVAARSRALVSGAMRGTAAYLTAVLSVLVAIAGSITGATVGEIASAILIAGMLATPITDLGRVTEYRQNFLAGVRVLTPILHTARAWQADERHRLATQERQLHHSDYLGITRGSVHVADLDDELGRLPELIAAPGARVVLTGVTEERIGLAMQAIVGDRVLNSWVVVAGRHLDGMPAQMVRSLVGVAARDVPLERGTIARIVRYRTPDEDVEAGPLLERVGLTDTVAALPDAERTTLRRGGEPLTPHECGLLKLARAIAGNPPLLVLDRLDDQLDAHGRETLERILADYPGCVIVRSTNPEAFLPAYDVWNVDELRRTLVIALPVIADGAHGLRTTTHLRGSGGDPFGPQVHRSAAELAAIRAEAFAGTALDEDDDDE